MKILSIFGTRPEAIKMAPLALALAAAPDIESRVCVTAQHREMLDQVLHLFNLIPDYDLNLMKPGQTLNSITADVVTHLKPVFEDFEPDLVLVHGDTTTTLASSLAAYYNQIPVGHVEAGLRTSDIYSPWPEEINRQLTSRICSLHFAPTKQAAENLIQEGIDQAKIFITGNTVVDALLMKSEQLQADATRAVLVNNELIKAGYEINPERRFILITGHRRESFGEGFRQICQALKTLALTNPDLDIVYPLHLNPNVQEPVNKLLSESKNIHLIEPLQYDSFVYMMMNCSFIITDSGGVQEEAPSLGKPVLVMRDKTERPEAMDAGTVKLVGSNAERIISEAQILLDDPQEYERMAQAHNPYGDGSACQKIIQIIHNTKKISETTYA